ncbi:hypothetical protein FBQ99_14905 [Chloroflexi bacterium CFX2]|nr:hypothetical protein [Chloroflexi bacterium CFX2]
MLDLVVGGYYVDRIRRIARKVIRIDGQVIEFISYHLDTGNCDGNPYQSLRTDFMRWVEREALPSELTDLQSRLMGQ